MDSKLMRLDLNRYLSVFIVCYMVYKGLLRPTHRLLGLQALLVMGMKAPGILPVLPSFLMSWKARQFDIINITIYTTFGIDTV